MTTSIPRCRNGRSRVPAAVAAIAALAAVAPVLAAPTLPAGLFGTFVGLAQETDLTNGAQLVRDIDIVVAPSDGSGMRIDWTNVTLVDGRRDVPGVKRRSDQLLLTPAPDRSFYLAGVGYDPFQDRTEPNALNGDALRWGVAEGTGLTVHSFMILDDGRYELQAYTRTPTDEGMALQFHRIVDGTVVREMTGHAVRAE